jgi:hypothetical protein
MMMMIIIIIIMIIIIILFYCCEELNLAILYAFNLSDLVSTFGIVATFAIFDMQRKLSRIYRLP